MNGSELAIRLLIEKSIKVFEKKGKQFLYVNKDPHYIKGCIKSPVTLVFAYYLSSQLLWSLLVLSTQSARDLVCTQCA